MLSTPTILALRDLVAILTIAGTLACILSLLFARSES
jgi:hypothetical protein